MNSGTKRAYVENLRIKIRPAKINVAVSTPLAENR